MTAPVLFVELDGELLNKNPRGAFEVLASVLRDYPEVKLVGVCKSGIVEELGLETVRNSLPLGLGERLSNLAPVYGGEKHEAVDAYCEKHAVPCHAIVDHDPWAFRLGSPNLVLVNPALGLSHVTAQAQLRQATQLLRDTLAAQKILATIPAPVAAPVTHLHSRMRLSA